MNSFLDPRSGKGELPRRMYARVDSREQLDPEGEEILVHAAGVDASWFEASLDRLAGKTEPPRSMIELMDGAPLAITEFWLPAHGENRSGELHDIVQPGAWLEIERSLAGLPVLQYHSLFQEQGIPQAVDIRRARQDLVARLNAAFSLVDVPRATEQGIARKLDAAGDIDFISVIDVGQGNACGLWRDDAGAAMYFDLGGGVVANTRTFPPKGVKFCRSSNPGVVLSHWDWDHWSSAVRYQQMLELAWLAPFQDLDPIHLAFAHELNQRNNLRIWPDGVGEVSANRLRVEKCVGDPRDKNNSGLAMTIEGEGMNGAAYRALLPGDAHFDSIPSVRHGERFDALVASHHGSRVDSIGSMTSPGAHGALVYSVGHGNSFGHPRLHAELAYLTAGWLPDRTFATTQSRRKRPCTIGLRLSRSARRTGCDDCNPKFWT